MRILGVIPARGGSVRVPRKNLQRVGGMTLVERAIQHAYGAQLLTNFVLSTDSPEIALINDDWVLRKLIRRCGPDGPMVDVLRDALDQIGGEWDAVVTIQPTSPLRTSGDIDGCIRTWLGWCDRRTAAVSVTAETGERNGAVYVSGVDMIREGLVFRGSMGAGEDIDIPCAMPASRSLDINTPEDLEEARRILGP